MEMPSLPSPPPRPRHRAVGTSSRLVALLLSVPRPPLLAASGRAATGRGGAPVPRRPPGVLRPRDGDDDVSAAAAPFRRRRERTAPSSLGNESEGNIDGYNVLTLSRGGDGAAVTSREQQRQASPFEYVPVTALDDYGQSTQLRHAMESAERYGTPVLACICRLDDDEIDDDGNENDGYGSDNNGNERHGSVQRSENAILVCSLQRPRLGVVSPPPTLGSLSTLNNKSQLTRSVHPSVQGMVRPLAIRDDATRQHPNDDVPRHALHSAIIATGIRSDSDFLLHTLQTHLSKYWFRYDALPSTASSSAIMEKMVQDVLLDCMGYDRGEELGASGVSGGIGSAAPSYDNNEEENGDRAGRPLGVCSFLLGLDSTQPGRSGRPLFIAEVKANGSSRQFVARAMGAGSQLANERLSQRWRRHMSQREARVMMGEILKDIAREKGWLPQEVDSGHNDEGLTVALETVTPRGIEIEFIPL